MRYVLFALSLLLAACDSPAPAMMGQEAQSISVGGADFRVRIRDRRAEAIRTNFMPNPSIGQVYPHAITAMEQASGCRVIEGSMRGDTNVMRADLSC